VASKNGPQDAIEPLVVKPREAWRLLGCSNTYGYELLAAGELESFKDGKNRKITMSSIKARIARLLDARLQAAPPELRRRQNRETAGPPLK
jgi:excisionase family DNA binding protein